MPEHALAGINVLDLTNNIGGAYCTKLLADLGATVMLVESPDNGHPLRHTGPFLGGEPNVDKSGQFLYFSTNKRSIALDIEKQHDRETIRALASKSDLIVETYKPGVLEQYGLGYGVFQSDNPRTVLTSITHFGQTGPYRDWESEEIVDYALGGYMYFGGNAEREPLMVHDNQPQLNAGMQAAIASLAALWWARKSGKGQHVDVSALESMLSAHAWTASSWTHEGIVMRRSAPDSIPCKDGWVWFFLARWDPNVFILIERPDLIDDPRFSDRQAWVRNRDELKALLETWTIEHSKEEIFRLGQELRLPVTPVFDASDLVKSPQLQTREWFLNLIHPVAGEHSLPGFPYKFSETPPTIQYPAPLLGDNNSFEPIVTPPPRPTAMRPPIEDDLYQHHPLPFKGVRILEITANWAGPLAGRHLADLGAEVIKIEGPDRPMTRGGRFPGSNPLRYHYNRSAYFNKMNRNKYGITLDLNSTKGRALFLRLAKKSDVIIENNSPRVMRNFNLDYSVLKKINPEIIVISISGFGQTGPDKDYVAYGANIEASSGLAAVTGYLDDDRPYRTTLFYADPVTAGHAAFAIESALFYRERTGKGQFVDLSLQENGITFLPESTLAYLVTGSVVPKLGNRHTKYAPQGCYPSYGDDSWIVLCIRSDAEWRLLCEVIGDETLADNPRFSTVEMRHANHAEIDSIISKWTKTYDHNEASSILQDAGIPSGPVLANWEMVSNHHINERAFYVPVAHKEMGVFPYPNMPWKLTATPGLIRSPSPCFGEHNDLIFRDFLRLDDNELDVLYKERVISDEPPVDLPGPIRI